MKTSNYLDKFCQRVMNEINHPPKRPIDLTAEQKETQARLNGCALMWKGRNLYALCVDAYKEGLPLGSRWRLIHRDNEFDSY